MSIPVTRIVKSGVSYTLCCVIVAEKLRSIHAHLYLGGLTSHGSELEIFSGPETKQPYRPGLIQKALLPTRTTSPGRYLERTLILTAKSFRGHESRTKL